MRSLQKEIMETLKVQPSIDPQEEFRRSVEFIKAYLTKHAFLKSVVLGISGGAGLDSGWVYVSNCCK
ncbi:NAD synthetase [Gracilibacillus boraciitolerans JCM 21714]|uniref:NAD synthetase n=1 Tax=Gracilibacillus boraciitolerans JCM 21714 TaxID=1298598 RepID=W4VKC2_9BACI|nr:NAD synthetase [Gracilibacillus boraciitolerans JCM 21714]